MLSILLITLGFLSGNSSEMIVDGYLDRLSVKAGDSIELYLHARQSFVQYKLRLYDLSGRAVDHVTIPVFPQDIRESRPYEKGFGYERTAKVAVPKLKSGVYLWDNKVPMIIRAENPKVVVVYSSNTENAYCNAGGKSLYDFNSTDSKKAKVVSFQRPIPLPRHSESFLRWMSRQAVSDVGYITDMDMDDYNMFRKASLLIIPGHSEYWTLAARKNFDRFVNEGKNALVLSGNTMWWQVRYSKAKDQLVCYKSFKDDPEKNVKLKTIEWNDARLGYSILGSIGADFPHAGYGLKNDKGWDGFKIVSNSPLLAGTSLKKGDVLKCPSDELDGAPIKGFDGDGIPILNRQALGFYRIELIGYDFVSRFGQDNVATWIVFKKTKTSGTVINVASTDWCSYVGMSNPDIPVITLNMIHKLLNKENVFSPEQQVSERIQL